MRKVVVSDYFSPWGKNCIQLRAIVKDQICVIRNPVGEPIKKFVTIPRSSMKGLKELAKKISVLLNTTNKLKSTKMARKNCSWR